jgi:hypothetical protein
MAKLGWTIRPEVIAFLRRANEVISAAAMLALGLWLIWLGGYFLTPLGLIIAAIAVAWGVMALRRMRFSQAVEAPGLVEVDEGQIGYLGPQIGGYVNLPDLIELRLLSLRGRRMWRLKQSDGQAILIPVDASGADRLFDAFASLPGMDTAALVGALQAPPITGSSALSIAAETRVIWRRSGKGVVAGG